MRVLIDAVWTLREEAEPLIFPHVSVSISSGGREAVEFLKPRARARGIPPTDRICREAATAFDLRKALTLWA